MAPPRWLLGLGALVFLSCAGRPASGGGGGGYDLKIIHGRVVDGTGAPWFRADVGIRGDEIVFVGDLTDAPAKRVIDARDQIVAPGFIDLLGQSEERVFEDPRLETKIRQGVTTEITGEGRVVAPLTDEMAQAYRTERPDFIPLPWRSFGQFFQALEKNRSALNFGYFVTSSNARQAVMGFVKREPTEAEIQQMEKVVDDSMKDGALGLSTALIYVPDTYSSTELIIRLAKVAARQGGVYFSHIRDERDTVLAAVDEAIQIGREASIPVDIWHLKVAGKKNWGRMPQVIEKIVAARASGLDMSANVYPYIASSTELVAIAPTWAQDGGYAQFLQRLKDPAKRKQIAEAMREETGTGEHILLTQFQSPSLARYQRKRLSEIARDMKVDPVEAAFRLLEASTASPNAIFFIMSEEDLRLAMRQPFVSICADSGAVVGEGRNQGAHPRAYGSFPRVLGRYVREAKLFTLEEAVRKMTSQSAARVKITDRGVIRPGKKADVVVFDPATVNDPSTYEDPHQMSVGVTDVIVNGSPVLLDGKLTGELPGRVLRGPGYRPAK